MLHYSANTLNLYCRIGSGSEALAEVLKSYTNKVV